MSIAQITAALIVKDEAETLPSCLSALAGLVGQVVVYDTGSQDGTPDLARSLGARVVQGYWDADFARARNAALDLVSTPWALVVDADEHAVGDERALSRALERASRTDVEVIACVVRNDRPASLGGPYEHPGLRLMRTSAARYQGRVHEQPRRADGSRLRAVAVRPAVLHVVHHGYGDHDRVVAKALRNAELAGRQLSDLVAAGAPEDGAAMTEALLDLGRALAGAGRAQDAVDTFETLRAVAPVGSPAWRQGSDHLARLLLGAGHDEAVVALAEQMRQAGAAAEWCDWLTAQALVQMGHFAQAAALMAGIEVLVDTGARSYDMSRLLEAKRLVQSLDDAKP